MESPPVRQREEFSNRERALRIPGAFPEDDDAVKIFTWSQPQHECTRSMRLLIATMVLGHEKRGKSDGEGKKRKIEATGRGKGQAGEAGETREAGA